jgi:hypothetical protein
MGKTFGKLENLLKKNIYAKNLSLKSIKNYINFKIKG